MPTVSAYWTLEKLTRHDMFILRVREAEFLLSRSQIEFEVRPSLCRASLSVQDSILKTALLDDYKEASERQMVLDRDSTTYTLIARWLGGVRSPIFRRN